MAAASEIGWEELRGQLSGLAQLATVTPEGEPHIAVVAPVVEGDTIWIFTRRSSAKARNIAAHGRVALLWRPGGELYLSGDAHLVDDDATRRRLWARPGLPFDPTAFFGRPDDADFVLVAVRPTRATALLAGPAGVQRRTWRR